MAVALTTAATAAPPSSFVSRGAGGGGAFFSPSINPFLPEELWVASDMSDVFVSRDTGRTWDTIDFRVLQGGSEMGRMQFTASPSVCFALNGSLPTRSTDGGTTWVNLPSAPSVESLWVDPTRTNRLLAATYTVLYLSTNGGAVWRGAFTNNDHLIAGVFWDGDHIAVGTRAGMLVSTNGGLTFAAPVSSGIPAGESMISFAGSRHGLQSRYFCVTWGSGDVYPGVQGSSFESYRRLYRMDGGTGSWFAVTNGVGANRLFQVGMSASNIMVAYAAGSDGLSQPSVVKTVDGGTTWTQVMRCAANANVATGWSGDDLGGWNWKKWSFGECALGFTVCASDPNRAVITDYGFIHSTTNGGVTWQQAYVWDAQENAAGLSTPKTNFYTGNGLEDTSCWWMEWFDSNTVFTSFTDIRGMWSTNDGRAWMTPMSLAYNSTYMTVRHPTNGFIYGAMSSVHDLYAWDRYCQDPYIDGGNGAVMASTNRGNTWFILKNFLLPVVSVALDPNRPERLYAALVHSVSGGIYRTTNVSAGVAATWTKLAIPPRTQGHPYNMIVLQDGSIVATYSARIASNNFQPSAGVFISTNDGLSWVDRTDVAMQYYTKDVTIDPFDPAQNTWYAGVWGEWGASANKGGLYRTTNRGIAWTRITTNLKAVGSCTFAPDDENEMYVTTEDQGLWYTGNAQAVLPAFEPVWGYPFRFPSRVFFNPYDNNEIWVTSFGNGMRLGRREEFQPRLVQTGEGLGSFGAMAAHGQDLLLEFSINMMDWQPVGWYRAFSETVPFTMDTAADQRSYRLRRP